MDDFERRELIERLQEAIFNNPYPATGIDGWTPWRGIMRTNQRPDGSVTSRRDKTVLRFKNGILRMYYHGSSFRPNCYIWDVARERFGERFFPELLRLYGINDDKQPRRLKTQSTPIMPTTNVSKEQDICTIPPSIVARTCQPGAALDTLSRYLTTILDPLRVEMVRYWYNVGAGRNGETIYWYFDRHDRCRDGKVMRYREDGHRDKDAAGAVYFTGSVLVKRGILPRDWKQSLVLFGEHLLDRETDRNIALVESEKTAIICAAILPEFVWMATGGANAVLDHAVSALSGRKVTVFPDADTIDAWTERFGKVSGWKVNDIAASYAKKGDEWRKCDIADILIYNMLNS